MRRPFALLILAGVLVWLWQQGDGGGRTLSGLLGGDSGVPPPAVRRPAMRDELRIEIPGDASSAERRHRWLLEQFGQQAAAIRWVENCLAERDLDEPSAAVDRDWEYACWEAYAQSRAPAAGHSTESLR